MMEQYAEIMEALATAIRRGQEALVRMDMPAFERLTMEQANLCQQLKDLEGNRTCCAAGNEENVGIPASGLQDCGLGRQRAILEQRCLGLQERIRHLNRVNRFLLNRARQYFELLLRLAALGQGTYSAQTVGAGLGECPARRD